MNSLFQRYLGKQLLRAVDRRQTERVIALLKRGANVHARDQGGNTPLMYASGQGNAEMVRLLCEYGADPNDYAAFTALDLAAGNPWEGPLGNDALETVRALLEAGADVNAVDSYGDTLIERIMNSGGVYGNDEIVALLRQYGAKE